MDEELPVENEIIEEPLTDQSTEPIETTESITSEVTISVESLNKFVELHNDQKQTNADFMWLLIGLVVGYIAIKGLLDHWRA